MKKTGFALLLILVLLPVMICGEGMIQEGELLTLPDSGLTLVIPAGYEYLGEYQGIPGYRRGDVAIMLSRPEATSLQEYAEIIGQYGLSFQAERILDTGSVQADVYWMDHPGYAAFIAVANPRQPGSAVYEISVMRNVETLDVRDAVTELTGSVRSLADVRAAVTDPAAWNSWIPFSQVGLALILPESMVVNRVLLEDGSEGYLHITDGICHLGITFLRCTIGELGVMQGFTSHDYEIFQSNAYGCWEYRRINPDVSEFTHLAFPGTDGTWLLISICGDDSITVYDLLDYVQMLYSAVH